ncbi:MAG: TadE/TadG family type IV pilus assembly protein [Pirellulaceae bacterium]
MLKTPKLKCRRGAVTVEMALCLPVLFLVLFFSFEISRAYFVRQTLDDAAFAACRTIKVPGATIAEAEAVVQTVLDQVGVKNYTTTITPSTITDATNSVTVTISAPMDQNMSLTTPFFKNKSLTATSTLKTERYRN